MARSVQSHSGRVEVIVWRFADIAGWLGRMFGLGRTGQRRRWVSLDDGRRSFGLIERLRVAGEGSESESESRDVRRKGHGILIRDRAC